MRKAHAFISYVRENSDVVDHLAENLRAKGVEVWLDRDDIMPGQNWKDAINEAIQSGAYFIACFSQELHSRAETYMHGELRLAIDRLRNMPRHRVWFIPVLINETDIPSHSISDHETLKDIHAVRLFNDWDGGLRKILRAMKLGDIRQLAELDTSGLKGVQPAFIYGQRVLTVFPTFISLISQLMDATPQLLARRGEFEKWNMYYDRVREYYYVVMERFLTDMPDLHREAERAIELIPDVDLIDCVNRLSDTTRYLSTAYERVAQSRENAIIRADWKDDGQNKRLYGEVMHLQAVCNSIVSRAGEYLDTLINCSFNRRQ